MAFTSTLLPLATPGTQYTGSSADTSDSGGDTSVSGRSCGLGRQGVRTVTLCRRHDPVRQSSALGFSLRGGREHGTGFFVSAVERGSEAFCQGLKIGDQIIRINGFPVEDATHREVLHLIQNQNNIRLKVRSVGMIPVKDSYNDTLTWQIVEPDVRLTVQQPPCHNECYRNNVNNVPCEDQSVAKLVINVAPKAKLGCGHVSRCCFLFVSVLVAILTKRKLHLEMYLFNKKICKGPDWKPGIFVQFTKENGLARNAGLRPGDQIIQCNNVTFTPDTPFSEAVSVLRSSGILELIIRKGAGLDLFPGESSGYNSSASSIAGDQSPETWPNKRLSIVKEESVIDSERLSQPESSCRIIQPEVDSVPNHSTTEMKPQMLEGSCTVIKVGPDPTRIPAGREMYQDSPEKNKSSKVAEICMVSQQLETTTTTVVVEVHQSEEDEINNAQSDASSTCVLTNSSSVSSFTSSGANSLCSAISQELQRRSQRRASDSSLVHSPVNQSKMELVKCGLDKEKVEQHQQLMEEFKRAHRKMFAHTMVENNKTPNGTVVNGSPQQQPALKSKEERESFRLKRQQLEQQHAAKMNQERAALAVKERDIKLERDKQDMSEAEREMTRLVRRQHNNVPPPPPPLPSEDEVDNQRKLSKCSVFIPPTAPPLPPSPPACPTPDYDTQSVTSENTISKHSNYSASVKPNALKNGNKNHNSEFVEMQSLESFKLTNPMIVKPKPPPTYFQQNPNRSSDSSIGSQVSSTTETVKPAVTIREYPTNQERKNPSRFPFLPPPGNTNTSASIASALPNGNPVQMEESITSRLQNELTQTLSRANLKTPDNILSSSSGNGNSSKTNVVTISINAQQNKSTKQQITSTDSSIQNPPFYLFHNENPKHNDRLIQELVNSSKQISDNGSVVNKSKRVNTRNHLTDNNSSQRNSVTFNFGKTSKAESSAATKLGHVQPNGILKNGSANGNVSQVHIHNTAPPSNKASAHKSIKFGGM